jgi:diguanylate cyclase (GGDEF)-like protein/PAS domain S-box-containing protein
MVEQTYDLVVALDAELRVVWANPRLTSMLGFTLDEARGQAALTFLHPDDRQAALDNLALFLDGGQPTDPTLTRVVRVDGTWCWVEIVGGHLPDDPEVHPARIVLSAREVTHREELARTRQAERAWHEAALRRTHERVQALLAHSVDLVMIIGPTGIIERLNPGRGLFGPIGSEQDDLFESVHDDDRDRIKAQFAAMAAEPGASITEVFRVRAPDGTWHWVEATGTNMLGDESINGFVVNYRDVTARVEAEHDAERLLEVLEATTDLVGLCDPDGRLLHLNRAARTLGGVEGRLDDMVVPGDWLLAEEDQPDFADVLGELERHGSWSGELVIRDRHGEGIPVLARMIAHRDTSGNVEFYSWILHDISDRKAAEDSLAHRATHDLLTGLPNRTLLLDRLRTALARSTRSGAQIAVLFVDLDHFKVVNDHRGHAEGDTVLRQIAGRFRDAVRPHDLVARYGGDEFVVVLDDLDDAMDAEEVAQRILDAMGQPFEVEGDLVGVGASVGIALAGGTPTGDPSEDADGLIRRADQAMYQAKKGGRGRVVTEP